MGRRLLAGLVLLLFTVPFSHALVNVSVSKDWRVAYLLGYYSHLMGNGFLAADSSANAKEVIPYLLPKNEDIVVYEDDDPFVKNYASVLRGLGFQNVKTVKVDDPYNLNFNLLSATNPKCYVIIQDSSGEWLYSGGAYAFAKGCGVILLNNRTIDRVISAIPKDADITIIGYNGKRLREAFPNAKVIFTGNKAKDSVEIAKIFPKKVAQVYLVSGMYLYLPGNARDAPVWTGGGGSFPVLIAYPEGVPDVVKEYILNNGIVAVSFIGPELDPAFGRFREEVGNKVKSFLLFQVGYQGVPTRQPGVPYPLPVLVLPSGDVRIDLESVSALPEGNLFLTFRNLGESAGYVLPTYVRITCGSLILELNGPSEPVIVYGRDSTVVELHTGEPLPQSGCKLYLEARYGPDSDRLIFEFNKELGFKPEQVDDPSKITVTRVVYSPRLEAFVIYVENESPVRVYATPLLMDVYVDGIPTDFKGRVQSLEPNASGKLYVKAVLTDADLIDNPEVKVVVRYGKYRNLPIKVFEDTFTLEKETLTDVVIEFVQENALLVGVALALIIIILLILRR